MSDPIRAALERLIAALGDYEPIWGGFPESALAAARAALDEQQGNEALVDPEHQGEDRQILHVFYDACMSEGGTADEIHLRGLRAVLSRWGHQPAPPADGEVAELVAWLQEEADDYECIGCEDSAAKCNRAAELLQQFASPPCLVLKPSPEALAALKAAGPGRIELLPDDAQIIKPSRDTLLVPVPMPVPVSERLPGPEDCDAEGRCWFYTPTSSVLCTYWVLRQPDSLRTWETHWLPAHALPQGEVE